MSAEVKVSVVTVTYNIVKNGRKDFLEQNFRSVRDQTLGGVEHVVVDGGSSDGTVDLLGRYAERGWITYISEPDKGIYDAMNKGLRMATGKYVVFLNSDDWWYHPDGLAESYAALERLQADFSYAPSYTTWQERPCHKVFTCIGAVLMQMPFCHQTMLTRRDRMLELGGFDAANFRSAADYNFILKLCLRGARFAYVPRNFTAYRHGGFSAGDRETSVAECIKSLHSLYSALVPGFSREEASRAYLDHVLPMEVFDVALNAVSPELREQILSLSRRIEGNRVVFDLSDYSYPIRLCDIDPAYPIPFVIRQRVLKFGGVPLVRMIERTNARAVKLMGVTVFTRKKVSS